MGEVEGKKTRKTRRAEPEPPPPHRPSRDAGAVAPAYGAPGFTRRHALGGLALALLVVASFLPALGAGFVWGDGILTGSRAVRAWSGLWDLWFAPRSTYRPGNTMEGHYWPLVYTTFWLEHKLWGYAPAGYHAVNVVLHFINALLLWRLLARLAVPGAWLAAAVFAVHPVHVESVVWVMGRKDLLSAALYLTAALTWLRYVEAPRGLPGAGRYCLALALFVAGLLAKSIVVTLPAALLLVHWWRQGRVTSTDWLRLAPFFVAGAGIAVADMLFYGTWEAVSLDYSAIERALIAAHALWFYLGKMLWPADLAVIYPLWDVDAANPLDWGYVVAAGAAVGLLWRLRHRLGRGPLAGAAFFAVTLSPVLGFVDFGYMQFSFVADRYQYLAGIGATTVLVGAAARGAGSLSGTSLRGVQGLALVVLVALGTLTWRQAGIYRDPFTFFSHVVSLNPNARSAHLNLVGALLKRGEPEDALAAARTALEQRPDYHKAHTNVGSVLLNLGRLEEAEHYIRRALEIEPQDMNTRSNLIELLAEQGRHEEALAAARIALEQHPDSSQAHTAAAIALSGLDWPDEAERHLRRAVELDPRYVKAVQNLAELVRGRKRYEESLELYRSVMEIDPALAEPYAGMGDALFRLKRYEEAVGHMERALSMQPGSPMARSLHYLAGVASEELGRPEAAAEHYERALATDPRYPEALNRLAALRFGQQRYEESLELYRSVMEIDPALAEPYAGMGDALFRLKRYEEAVGHMERALSMQPGSPMARSLHYLAGVASEELGRPEAAAEHYERALATDPRYPEALNRLAALRFGQQRYEEALDLYRALAGIDPDNANVHADMGAALYQAGRADEALRSFNRALALDPAHAQARTNREQVRRVMRQRGQ